LKSELTPDKKINPVKRMKENIVAHYNFYFNANNKLQDVLNSAKKAHKDSFNRPLAFYNYTLDQTAAQKQELDSVIHKSNNGILLHDLRNDWVDDLYLLMGQAYYYQKKFDSAYDVFQYINYTFQPRTKDEMGLEKTIGSNINTENLSEDKFFPIFEACQELNMAVMIHPWQMMGFDQLQKYWLPWLVGMPAETSRAACSLIFGGVMERLPKLRICFSHAGGSFLPTIGRIEHGFNCRPDLVAIDNPVNPRKYVGHFWVDSATHDDKLFQYVLDMQGSKRVTLGTDYPFPLGDLEVGRFITQMNLEQSVIEDVFCNATLEWLKLDRNQFS
jgi:hypothetical protein